MAARDPYRSSTGDVNRGERWDRERFMYERDRDRYGDEHVHIEEDDRYYGRGMREGRGPRGSGPRFQESSEDHGRGSRPWDDEYTVRERRSYWDEEPRPQRARSPPTADFDRKLVIEHERRRSPSPPPPPSRQRPGTLLRRQSSLDTFDRRPATRFWERDEYGPPARREDFRPPPNVPIPLPRTRALPPPRRYAERDYYDEIRVSDPDYYGDEDFRSYPQRVREKEYIRERRRSRNRSRESRSTHSHHTSTVRGSSRSTSTSASSSIGGTTVTAKSEYPKKGKTRIPARLVSKRVLIDLHYPYTEEGNTIVVQKALGQENIDELLKLSEEYLKSDREVESARSHSGGDIIEERREEFFMTPAPPQPATTLPAPPVSMPPPAAAAPPPVIEYAPAPPQVVYRDVSPSRATSITTSSSRTPVIVDARPHEYSTAMAVGPLALVQSERHHHHQRHRSHSRSHRGGELIRSDRDIVQAERLSNGELVLYEERVEKIEEPRRGVRIEKDKKGPPPSLMKAMLATLT